MSEILKRAKAAPKPEPANSHGIPVAYYITNALIESLRKLLEQNESQSRKATALMESLAGSVDKKLTPQITVTPATIEMTHIPAQRCEWQFDVTYNNNGRIKTVKAIPLQT